MIHIVGVSEGTRDTLCSQTRKVGVGQMGGERRLEVLHKMGGREVEGEVPERHRMVVLPRPPQRRQRRHRGSLVEKQVR